MRTLFAYTFGVIAALFIGSTATAQTSGIADSTKSYIVKVSNLHCNNDMPTIKKQLLNKDGIDEVIFTDISGVSSTFTITYHTSAINPDQIEKTIEDTPGCDDKSEKPYRVKKESSRKKAKS